MSGGELCFSAESLPSTAFFRGANSAAFFRSSLAIPWDRDVDTVGERQHAAIFTLVCALLNLWFRSPEDQVLVGHMEGKSPPCCAISLVPQSSSGR